MALSLLQPKAEIRPLPILAVLLLLVAGCSGPTRIDLDTQPARAGLLMNVTGIAETERGLEVTLDLRNGSREDFVYWGYSRTQPVFAYEYLTAAAWVRPMYLLCGTGMARQVLAPGERIEVKAIAFGRNRLQRLRVGIDSQEGGFAVWSPVIDLATRSWGVKREGG